MGMENEVTLISPDEINELNVLEETIKKSMKQFFYNTGAALAEINAKRLYIGVWDTFEEYCRERWMLIPRRAYQLIQAAQIYRLLETEGFSVLPFNENQCRQLTGLPEGDVINVWSKVLNECEASDAGAKIIGNTIRRVLTEVNPNPEPEEPEEPDDDSAELRIAPDVEALYNQFRRAVERERDKGWKDTTPEALRRRIRGMLKYIK